MDGSDARFIRELLNEPAFLHYIGDRGVRTEADARRYIQDGPVASYRQHGFGLFVVEIRATGEAIGICGLVKRDELADADIGFAFLESFWSKGYAFESASAVMRHAKHQLGLQRVVAITLSDNGPSIRLLKKLGLTYARPVGIGGETLELYQRAWR